MTKHEIIGNITGAIDEEVAKAMLGQYEKLSAEHRMGNAEATLIAAGKFAENVLRAIDGYRKKSKPPAEIKACGQALDSIRKDVGLPESVRVSIVDALTLIFNIRSKRGAAHVKAIDPGQIDAALVVSSASWVVAELIRLFHTQDEKRVAELMASLMRGDLPLIERFAGEIVVTTPLTCEFEILLQLAQAPQDRRALGQAVKYPPPTITRTLARLLAKRHVHQTREGTIHITGPGEKYLGGYLAQVAGVVVPLSNKA